MSVPLDRLYNFLHGLCNRDILIYRFNPPGSKNIEDLAPLYDYNRYSWLHRMITPLMFCHDQEPLQFSSEMPTYLLDKPIFQPNELSQEQNVELKSDLFAQLNLRLAIEDNYLNGYDKSLLCHSEKNSDNLRKYEAAGFVGVYWWSHAAIARDWFRYANVDPTLSPTFDTIQKDFLVYNRAWSGSREYRLTFVELAVINNLIPHCDIKFSPTDNNNSYTNHVFKNPALQITSSNLQDIVPLNDVPSWYSADYNGDDYATSGIEVVLETVFDDQRNHLTEKSLRPIACGRPFILAATPGSLQYLRDYGFKTFDGLIDETYDTILNPKQRLVAIINEMKRISNLSQQDKTSLWTSLYAIADSNKQHFFSEQFSNKIANEFKDNFDAGVAEVLNSKAGSYMKMFEADWLSKDPALAQSYYNRPGRTPDNFASFSQWLKT